MRITKGIVSAAVGLALLLPSLTQASGLTSSQVSAVITLLQSFNVDPGTVATVEAVLDHTSMPGQGEATSTWTISSTSPAHPMSPLGPGGKMGCITLSRDLTQGSQGNDVKELQEMLAQDPSSGFTAAATGFFGPLTARAMAKFQMQNGIASSTNGSVGPLTRAFFGRQCGAPGQGQGVMIAIVGGEIESVNGSSMTLQGQGDQSIMVHITASTTISVFEGSTTPATSGTIASLVVGKNATVEGPRTQGGSINALTIEVGAPPLPMPPPTPMQGDNGTY